MLYWLVLSFRERKNVSTIELKTLIIVSYLQSFDAQNYNLFKIPASGLILKIFLKRRKFQLRSVLMQFILEEKKSITDFFSATDKT